LFTVLAAGALAMASISIEVQGNCPSVREVEDQRRALAAPEPEPSSAYRAVVVTAADRLEITLQDGSRPLAHRAVAGLTGCDGRAALVAVVIAAWENELRVNPMAFPPPPAPVHPSVCHLELSLGASGSWVEALSPGAEASASLSKGANPWAAELSALLLGGGTFRLGNGRVAWRRYGLGLGGQAGLIFSGWRLEVGLRAIATLLTVRGLGFEDNRFQTAFDPGLWLGGRISRPLGPVSLWVSVAAVGYPRAQRVRVEDGAGEILESRPVPRLEGLLSFGVRFQVW
jgi:hypothetical protein